MKLEFDAVQWFPGRPVPGVVGNGEMCPCYQLGEKHAGPHVVGPTGEVQNVRAGDWVLRRPGVVVVVPQEKMPCPEPPPVECFCKSCGRSWKKGEAETCVCPPLWELLFMAWGGLGLIILVAHAIAWLKDAWR